MSKPPRGWCALATEAGTLGIDAWTVIGLRLVRLAGGGAAAGREAQRMVEEKLIAHNAFAQAVASGRIGLGPRAFTDGVLTHYGPWIRANRRRLARACAAAQSR